MFVKVVIAKLVAIQIFSLLPPFVLQDLVEWSSPPCDRQGDYSIRKMYGNFGGAGSQQYHTIYKVSYGREYIITNTSLILYFHVVSHQ